MMGWGPEHVQSRNVERADSSMDPIEMMKCCEMIVGAMMDDPCYPPPPPPPGM